MLKGRIDCGCASTQGVADYAWCRQCSTGIREAQHDDLRANLVETCDGRLEISCKAQRIE